MVNTLYPLIDTLPKEITIMLQVWEIILGSGVIAALIAAAPKLMETFYAIRKQTGKDEIKNVTLIYEELKNMINQSEKIDRIMILKTTNGGGKPKLGVKIYATALYQDTRPPHQITKYSYQKLEIDPHYMKMLNDCEINNHVSLVVPRMPHDALLRHIYIEEGIKYSEIYHIRNTKNSFYYMSISSHQTTRFTNPTERLTINIGVSNIRNLFKNIKD